MDEEITRLDAAVSLFAKTLTMQEVGINFPVTVRVPLFTFAEIEALASHSAQSRNRVVCEVLAVGLEAIRRELPTDDAAAVHELFQKLVVQYVGEGESGEIS